MNYKMGSIQYVFLNSLTWLVGTNKVTAVFPLLIRLMKSGPNLVTTSMKDVRPLSCDSMATTVRQRSNDFERMMTTRDIYEQCMTAAINTDQAHALMIL